MSKVVKDILEKMKKVEGGYLDQEQKGEGEQNFIDKHIDNVAVHDAPAVEKENGHPHAAGEKKQMVDRKKHRKGYNPGEDAEVYESADFDDDLFALMEDMTLEESTDFFFGIVEETVQEFLEEATDEEKEIVEEIMADEDSYIEFIEMMLEAKCDDDEEEDDDEVIEAEPKLKKDKPKKGDSTEVTQEDIERRADVKMVKVKTPDGKVVYRKQRPEIKIGD